MPFEYLEDEAIADIAFKAKSKSLSELFREAVLATCGLQTDLQLLKPKRKIEIDIEKGDGERLLKALLDEILFLKDSELFFVKDIHCDVQPGDKWRVKGFFIGDDFDDKLHPIGNDLKAITWHNFYLKEIDNQWECYVLIDI